MNLSGSVLVSILAVLGGGGGLVSVLYAIPTLRRLAADTRKVETETDGVRIDAAGVVSAAALEQMQAALARATHAETEAAAIRREMDVVRRESEATRTDCDTRLRVMEQEMERYRDAAQEHVVWDVQRIGDLTRLGVAREDIPNAPPLLPRGAVNRGSKP